MSEVAPFRKGDALGPRSALLRSWCAVWEANLFSSTPVCDMLLCVNTFVSKFTDVDKMTFVRACAGHASDTQICLPLTTPSSQEGKGD